MFGRALVGLVLLIVPASAGARDRGADGEFSQRTSSHFQLLQDVDIDRYSGPRGSREFERDVLDVLERAYRQVGDSLALRPRTRIRVVIYDPGVFDHRFSALFGFRAAGFYDGVIHVRGNTRVDTRLVATLHHEYSHAAVDSVASGIFPGWLNEGLAEYFEAIAFHKRHLDPAQNAVLVGASRNGTWIPLAALSAPSFSHLSGDSASLAYLESYATVEHLVRRYGVRRLRDLCKALVRTRGIERALDRTYRRSLSEIEADLREELR